jgi:LEA14-like dessication related protein
MRIFIYLSLVLLFAISGCATLREYSDVREPDVQFRDMSIENITFDGVTLLFDFDVSNPNRFGVNADRYSYEFFINDQSFISGNMDERISIEQESTSRISVPVTLNFSEVYQSFSSILRQDRFAYQLSTEVQFNLPVVGNRTVPVSTSGEIPIPKPPRVEFGEFDIKQVSLSGAEAEVSFRVTNPNTFAISLLRADYNLRVNGREWLDTTMNDLIRVAGSESREVRIPIRLNSAQLGSALMDLMGGNSTFNYELKGNADVSADLEGFPVSQEIPFELSGSYSMD